MQCPNCRHENPAASNFCESCGSAFSVTCSNCKNEISASAKFCNHCGHAQGAAQAPETEPEPEQTPRTYTPKHLAERILTTRSALEGERKHVTVLFADLADSTSLAERVGAEEMHAIMDRCFQLMLEQVHRFEGTVNQFTGDGIMALFGAPLALEDAPRRAVMAALGIQRALEPLAEDVQARHHTAFQMRIGIHTGPVVVGRIGDDLRMDYTAVGDTTNLADRLQTIAPPGGILISEATESLVAGFFERQDLGVLAVKGRSQPVHAFAVEGERAVRGRIEAAVDAGLTPLFGREQELHALQMGFESARQGHGQVVFVVGEAGIGKSRLQYEFRRQLAGEPHTWLEGHCTSYGRNTAFEVIADLLRRDAGIDDHDDDASALGKLERNVQELGDDLAWTVPFVSQLLSLPVADPNIAAMDAVTRRSETFRALAARFLRSAEKQPLVLVIEDLHWIDAASEEYLTFLTDSIPATRALLIFTHRPGYRHPFGDRSYHVRVALQALAEGATAAMAGSLLASTSLPPALSRLIAEKAEGNPFFIEEVTKSLLEEGVLRVQDGRVELVRDIEEVSVPDSIQDVLMARLDRLADGPKRAIQIASVIGREFALRLLQRISESGTEVDGVVEELRGLELIYERSVHPELAYMFKHALTHEVAYESVLVQRRKALHQVVGLAIEDLYADRLPEHYEALAHHFSVAENWQRAFRYHECASEKCAAAYANHAVAEHCQKALEIAERLRDEISAEQRCALEERLGLACWSLSEFATSGDAYLRAAEQSPEPATRATNLARAAYSLHWAHDYPRGRDAADAALALAREENAPGAQAAALVAHDHEAWVIKGDLTSDHRADEAARLAEQSGNAEAMVMARWNRALWAEQRGEFRRAVELCESTSALARQKGLTHLAIFPQWFLGLSLCGLGQYGRALSELQEGVGLCDRVGDHALKTRLLNSLGWCFAEFGCHTRASVYNQQSTELAAEMVALQLVPGAEELHANATINLACNRLALGDADAASELLVPIREELDRSEDPWMRWRYSLHLHDAYARIALARGEPERALEWTERELAGAEACGARKLRARALELRGRALVVIDQRDGAEEALRRALAAAREIEYPPVVWRSLSLLAELASRAGDRPGAARLANEAHGLVEGVAQSLPAEDLRLELAALGRSLVEDPLSAYR